MSKTQVHRVQRVVRLVMAAMVVSAAVISVVKRIIMFIPQDAVQLRLVRCAVPVILEVLVRQGQAQQHRHRIVYVKQIM